jgi:hypothetical protein
MPRQESKPQALAKRVELDREVKNRHSKKAKREAPTQ